VTAYVDESYQDGVYVLAAVLDSDDGLAVRQALKDARLRRQMVVHFGKESAKRRVLLAEMVSGLGLTAVVAVRTSRERPERARGRCLNGLVWALGDRASHLVIEARQQTLNNHDRSVLAGASRRFVISASFVPKTEEPLLWAADVIAGAVFHDLARGDSTYRAALGAIEVHQV
jgi:hypothetical protein